MNNPDSAMALATEINNYLNPLYNIGREQLAAIIRKHQAKEIGELMDKVRRIQNYLKEANGQDAYGLDMDVATRNALSEVESLLSRYPKV
jgi:hypothetical protein